MKWDFAIGNPPYQQETENISLTNGQLRSKSVFHFFQIEADKIARESTVLIYPAGRWIQRSGKGMASFGLEQINDHRLSKVYFYPDSKEVFSSAAIADGISVVVKDMNKTSSGFDYIYCKNGKENGVNIENPGENIIPLNPKDISIVRKLESYIKQESLHPIHDRILPQKLFGIESDFVEKNSKSVYEWQPNTNIDYSHQVKLYANDRAGKAGRTKWFIAEKSVIKANPEYISYWKVVVSSANAGGQKRDNQLEIIDNHSAFGRSRVALGAFKTKAEAQNFYKYVNSYIARYAFLMTDEALTTLGMKVPDIGDYSSDNNYLNFRVSDAKALEKGLNSQFDRAANKVYNSYQIEQNTAESDRLDALRSRHETGKSEAEIEAEFEQKKKELQDSLQEQLSDAVKSFIETSTQSVVETTEKKIKEREKAGIEDSVRDHLRGFSRTIPSFLMAYGDDTVTLATFDAVIPNPVFLEVTSITLDQFRFLRDGGKYTDAETGEERDFAGNLFDPVVFDDSVKEFLRLKKKLADYFDEKSIEDIFDYIPPQKTNQIFTPKTMVKKMVDMLEAENPGCFDDPDKTFIDLYMKSGLYITEIVKRLYQSEQMKKQFPDPKERLRHIFEKQVYGLAPTEIIYHIALSYILGFNNEDTKDIKHNFRQLDALPYAKEGTLQQKLDELFS